MLGGRPWAVLLGLIACSAPVLAAGYWLSTGVSGPVHQVSSPVVPELVAAGSGQGRQARTLVLRSASGHISYLLLRGPSPSLADAALTPPAGAERALSKVVSALTTPGGSLAADQAQLLADFDIGYVLIQAPVDGQLATELNNVSGLRPYSTTGRYSLWQLDTPPARVAVREPDGTIVPVVSGATGVGGVAAPAAGGILMLAEPAGGWSASVNGHALAAVPSPAGSWAQAFRLPGGGGTLTVGHSGLTRDLLLILELLAFLVVAALALPGIHVAEQDDAVDGAGVPVAGQEGARGGARTAGRRAAAGAGAAGLASAGAAQAGSEPAGADLAGARTAVIDRPGRSAAGLTGAGLEHDDLADDDLADDDLAGAGLAGPGVAGSGMGARGGLAGARAARRGGAGDAEEPGADVATGRRGLAKGGRGRSQQGGRGTRGRGARGRDAARQRTGLTKGSRAALSAAGTPVSDDGVEDAAETTLLAAGSAGAGPDPAGPAAAGTMAGGPAASGRKPRDEGRAGWRSDSQPAATVASRTRGHTTRPVAGATAGSPTRGPITPAATASQRRAAVRARGSSGPRGSTPTDRPAARRMMTTARPGGRASPPTPADPTRSADGLRAGTGTGPKTTLRATRCGRTASRHLPGEPGPTKAMPTTGSLAVPGRPSSTTTATRASVLGRRRQAGARRPGAHLAVTGPIPSWTRPQGVSAGQPAGRRPGAPPTTPGPARPGQARTGRRTFRRGAPSRAPAPTGSAGRSLAAPQPARDATGTGTRTR